jgi:shikimate dehydrogenase
MNDPKSFRAAGVIGWPIFHSRSPVLHTYWLEKYGIAGVYIPMPVRPEQVESALRGLAPLGFAGCNVTIPHKEETARVMDRIDPLSERIGAVNLVVVQPDGSLSGFNTDVFGFVEGMRDRAPHWRADAGPAVVLGAGGAARSVVVALLEGGASEIRLVNRTGQRAEQMASELGEAVRQIDWRERCSALAGAALVVNTTSQGMSGQPPLDLSLDEMPGSALVCDINYNPLETPLLAAARARGNPTVDGLGMLIQQARPSFEAWFGVMPEATAELRARAEATLR